MHFKDEEWPRIDKFDRFGVGGGGFPEFPSMLQSTVIYYSVFFLFLNLYLSRLLQWKHETSDSGLECSLWCWM